jgi:hypothetical protein
MMMGAIDDLFSPSTLERARTARDEAMTAVAAKANRAVDGWTDTALLWLERYARSNEFINPEECSKAAYEWGLSRPPDDRAWGSVYTMAQRRGYIKRSTRTYQRTRGHATLSFLWQSLIFKQVA